MSESDLSDRGKAEEEEEEGEESHVEKSTEERIAEVRLTSEEDSPIHPPSISQPSDPGVSSAENGFANHSEASEPSTDEPPELSEAPVGVDGDTAHQNGATQDADSIDKKSVERETAAEQGRAETNGPPYQSAPSSLPSVPFPFANPFMAPYLPQPAGTQLGGPSPDQQPMPPAEYADPNMRFNPYTGGYFLTPTQYQEMVQQYFRNIMAGQMPPPVSSPENLDNIDPSRMRSPEEFPQPLQQSPWIPSPYLPNSFPPAGMIPQYWSPNPRPPVPSEPLDPPDINQEKKVMDTNSDTKDDDELPSSVATEDNMEEGSTKDDIESHSSDKALESDINVMERQSGVDAKELEALLSEKQRQADDGDGWVGNESAVPWRGGVENQPRGFQVEKESRKLEEIKSGGVESGAPQMFRPHFPQAITQQQAQMSAPYMNYPQNAQGLPASAYSAQPFMGPPHQPYMAGHMQMGPPHPYAGFMKGPFMSGGEMNFNPAFSPHPHASFVPSIYGNPHTPELPIHPQQQQLQAQFQLQQGQHQQYREPHPPTQAELQVYGMQQKQAAVEAREQGNGWDAPGEEGTWERTHSEPSDDSQSEIRIPPPPGEEPVWVMRESYLRKIKREEDKEQRREKEEAKVALNEADRKTAEWETNTDEETDRLLGEQRLQGQTNGQTDKQQKQQKKKEVMVHEPAVLIEGVLFRARYLGSTQLSCEERPNKATRMSQAQEAVGRIKAPEGEPQPGTDVDLFISTEKIMVLNTDLQDIMMDHPLRTISYIADIGEIVVLMARRVSQSSSPDSPDDGPLRRTPKVICHVFESEEAQFIAQSIGQAFQVAYMEFLRANGIDDPRTVQAIDYEEVLNSQEIMGDELEMFARKETQKDVVVPKQKGEILGVVVVESGWGSMLPTVVIANLMTGGPASRCNQLNIGDQITCINGISLVGLPLSSAQQQIKNAKTQTAVKLTVVHTPPVVEVRIKRPDTKYQLGFSVQNGVICSLLRGGIAERGGVRVGHRIIEINNQSVVAVAHEKIVNMLATAVGEIQMKTMPTSMFRLLTGQETPLYL